MKIKQLEERRAALLSEMQAPVTLAEAESRDLTPEEMEIIESREADIDLIDRQIKAIRTTQQRAASAPPAAPPARGPEPGKEGEKRAKAELAREFSLLRAVRNVIEGKQHDGAEKEAYEEATSEFEESRGRPSGTVRIPSFIADPNGEKRTALTAGTAATLGNTVDTVLGQFIEPLRPVLAVEQMGATSMTGLQGDLSFPRQTTLSSATWAGETDTAAETNPVTDLPSMTPHRLAAWTEYSRRLFLQSSISVENLVRSDLAFAIRAAVDSAAINGSGSGSIPKGILNYSGIGVHAGATNGLAPDRNVLIDIMKELRVYNAFEGNLGWLTTPGVKSTLMKTKVDDGSGIFVWDGSQPNELMGYRAMCSTQVPSNLTKGSGTNLHAIIFGNWQALMIAQWGGIDIMVNQYSKMKEAKIELVANSYWDFLLRHDAFFAASKDAIVS